jgi:hypothetical protein
VEKLRYMHRNPVVRVWCRRRKSGTGAVTVITLWESGAGAGQRSAEGGDAGPWNCIV